MGGSALWLGCVPEASQGTGWSPQAPPSAQAAAPPRPEEDVVELSYLRFPREVLNAAPLEGRPSGGGEF